MSYLGSWKIDDLLTFPANTHRFDTGAGTDADSAPAYRVYEDETSTPILTGTMALLDGSNTAGFYTEQITLSAANGLEKGKSYTIYISATVNSVTGTMSHTFQIEAEVDANAVSNLNANVITAASIATGAIDADAIADNAIDAGAIAADAITAAKIADGAIDANTFATGAITAAAIAADAIGASELAADAVAEIQSGLATSANQTTILSRIGTPTDLGGGASLSANLVDIEGQTDEIGAAGAGLSAIPWNAAWDTEVQSEVQDAIEANNLDHLVGTATGIPSVPAGTYLDQIMDDGTANYDRTTDSLQAIRDRGDSAWTTATLTAQNVWEYATRTLTAFSFSVTVGTNNDKTGYSLSAAGIQAIWDALTSALTTVGSIGKLLVDNINATISSRSSHSAADVWAVATRVLTAGTNIVLAKGTGVTGFNDLSAAEVNAEVVDVLRTDTLPDSYASDGSQPTIAQAILAIHQFLTEKSVTGTTVSVKKPDGSTVVMQFTLDNGTTPTSITRSS